MDGTTGTSIPAGDVRLVGDLVVPADARGIVLFAHGSGSSRHSPRNRMVAEVLNRSGLATVLVDLLTPEEEALDDRTGELRFDIGLLTARLVGVVDWLATGEPAGRLPIGLFGASTGAAAALRAAAQRPDQVYAVVSRGGRPDLAGADLARVRAGTLLLVGGLDEEVLRLNDLALADLDAGARLRVVPGASHLFAEPGTLDQVAREAAEWFVGRLPG
ncbi:dienelactone hydrolase family protein [Plantactinospora sp. WMMB782]|uniref:dienelactone hydrolase family protein n=1 Tax=Plantactinospora sp. WMMB782 TaxID=3404121 RepID=UPI003B946985